jgi:hypothetical protein
MSYNSEDEDPSWALDDTEFQKDFGKLRKHGPHGHIVVWFIDARGSLAGRSLTHFFVPVERSLTHFFVPVEIDTSHALGFVKIVDEEGQIGYIKPSDLSRTSLVE